MLDWKSTDSQNRIFSDKLGGLFNLSKKNYTFNKFNINN